MIDLLYPVSYLVSLSGLIGWFYVQDNKRRSRQMSKLFLGGFFAYLISLGMAQGELPYKLFVLFRDLVVLGIVSQFFSFFRKYKILFFGMLFALYGMIGTKGMGILQATFPENASTNNAEEADMPTGANDQPATTKNKLANLDENGELLIEIYEGNTIEDIADMLKSYGITYKRAFHPEKADFTDLDDYYVLNVPDNQLGNLAEIEKQLYKTIMVDWVEENEVIKIAPIEATKLAKPIEKKFGINDPGLEQMWGFEAMGIDQFYKSIAADNIQPQRKATIAILDTGVDAKHEDLAGNYKSIKSKYDKDTQGHGTHCAGIAGSVSNNATGVASFSQNNEFVQITSIPVLNSFGMGTQKNIIDGIIEAADNKVDVISMSLGGKSSPTKQKAYERAIKYANDAGAIVVVAAGNSNDNAKKYAPANVKGVIAVSAIDQQLKRATFSNYVNDLAMGVAAPGVDIYSTFPKNEYKTFNGTSMATPYVSGLVGVLKSINPALNTAEVYDILQGSGVGTNSTSETGRFIQPGEAVKLVPVGK
ncbi:MAG: S8 family serine peptidase [Saprospiraceae bacterium]